MAQNDTKYCGKAKRKTGRYGEFFTLSFSPADIELMLKSRTESGWLNLVMNEMRSPDRRGNTHTLSIDDWRPDGGARQDTGGSRRPAAPDPDYGPPTASGRDDGGFGPDALPQGGADLPPMPDDDIPF